MELLDDLIAVLRQRSDLQAAWLLGSLATATASRRADSDLDVAVLGERPLSARAKKQLIERLARVAGRPVDLVDLCATQGPIVGQVLQKGRLLFCRDSSSYAEQMYRFLFDQADWMPLRRHILKTRQERCIEP
jgi:predicted nucleotidyltransferase